jgi:hypothetical protein
MRDYVARKGQLGLDEVLSQTTRLIWVVVALLFLIFIISRAVKVLFG